MFGKKEKATGTYDWIIAGLGNPGRDYETTRHNVGFMVLDCIAEKHGVAIKKVKFKSVIGDTTIFGKRCLFMKPQTYMNLSGQAVTEAMSFYKIPPERVLVIFDDITLPPGKLRIRPKGSDGGHNGMKNIIYLSGSDQFPRIKVGVGAKPHPDYDLKDWVLSSFTKEDAEQMKKSIPLAAEAVSCIIQKDTETAMNQFNGL